MKSKISLKDSVLYDNWDDLLYQDQQQAIENYYLLGQMPKPIFHDQILSGSFLEKIEFFLTPFLNTDVIVAGGFLSTCIRNAADSTTWPINDVDIYIHGNPGGLAHQSNSFLMDFIRNPDANLHHHNNVSCHVNYKGVQYNIVYGIPFKSPTHLISGFDFRVCSMVYDIPSKTLTNISGAIFDAIHSNLNINLSPRQLSIKRLLKYLYKGYKLSAQQRHIFTELLLLQGKNYDIFMSTYEE